MFYKGRRSSLDLGGGQVFLPELVTVEKKTKSGKVTEVALQSVSQSKDLPNLLDVSLSDMLEAGTPLKMVSPVLFKPAVSAEELLGSEEKSEEKPEEKPEVKPQVKEKTDEE